ncbi:MAG: 2-oxo-hepta-3-ene-1,7-dioic acid hydratase, partial [Comamonadaceae bacterium]|nr:2-oxo-hepta-3-ene-1,7-dioic acid hydratase [Comamonadaceae bacterium]
MLDDTLIQQLAAELDHAERTRVPLEHFSRR